ncbi:MAG: GAF domain-containing protein [Bdellovibrionales bacterium]|nr:GAF domain-containing protein [Bdellovibrionales bacterium]
MVEAVRKAQEVVRSVFGYQRDALERSRVSDGNSSVEHWQPEGTSLSRQSSPHGVLAQHLCRLSRLGANIADAHSCFVFLPAWMLDPSSRLRGSDDLILGGFHSLSRQVISDCRLSQNTGLVGWAAKHGRSIHVSPFERDSRTLGMYSHDQGLKSFIAVPFSLASQSQPNALLSKTYGVIACDSCKSYAFSKTQMKILEDFACEVGQTALLHLHQTSGRTFCQSWNIFLQMSERLSEEVGIGSLEILRLRLPDFGMFEHIVGVKGMCCLSD